MRIGICEFRQESDSFNPVLSDLKFFEHGGIHEGQVIHDELAGKQVAVAGMIAEVEKAGATPVYLYSMHTDSGGPVEDRILSGFISKTLGMIAQNLPLDGLLVSLHGATQTPDIDDVSGHILETFRHAVGPDTVIAASFDLHANITDKVQRNADFICGYQTYPHVDFYETGARAARLLLGRLSGKVNAKTYRTVIPMIVPASSYTTLRGKFGAIAHLAHTYVEKGRVLDYTIFQMQPWLDVSEGGTSIVTIGENEAEAKAVARELAKQLYEARSSFTQELMSIDEVIAKAESNNSGRPTVLVDSPDSPNAGACGDSPALLERIKALKSNVKAAFYLIDVKAVATLWNRDIGGSYRISLGATKCDKYYKPVEIDAEILSKHNGVFIAEGPSGRGTSHDCGRVVVVRWRNVDIVICESISFPGDPQIYRHFGIEPTFYQLVNVKACTSFRVSYEPFAEDICETDTPGTAPIDLSKVEFNKLPHSFWPWSDLNDYVIPEAKALR